MAKFRAFLAKPAVTVLLFLLAIGLLTGGGVGGARAALSVQSEVYESTVELPSIGVQLLENGQAVSGDGALMKSMLGGDTVLKPGKTYSEVLAVQNNGTIDEFVRVTVQKYWLDSTGAKAPFMDSSWITLGLVTDGWVVDTAASTEERTVLYYTSALPAGSAPVTFMESVTLDGKIAQKVTQNAVKSGDLTTITTVFDYDGYQLCLKASVDSVQTHSGQEAVKSAWGRSVTVSGNSLSLG